MVWDFFLNRGCIAIALASIVLGEVVALEVHSNPRNTFPGRRVGGGTRGECNARALVHLVPDSSVFAPGASGLLGLVEGPAENPFNLTVQFKSGDGGLTVNRTFMASSSALTLMTIQDLSTPTVWESSFECSAGDGMWNDDPIAFIQSSSPPARSLLLPEAEGDDLKVQNILSSLRQYCGKKVPAQETLARFGLADLVTEAWPRQLRVRCSF